MQAAGDETSDIFVDLKNCGLQVWLLIKIHSPIGDEAFGPNRRAAGYDLNRCFHVEFMASVAKPYLTKVHPTDSVVTLTFQLTEKMQKSSPLLAETDIYLYLAANLLKSYFLLPYGVQLPVKLISKDSGI